MALLNLQMRGLSLRSVWRRWALHGEVRGNSYKFSIRELEDQRIPSPGIIGWSRQTLFCLRLANWFLGGSLIKLGPHFRLYHLKLFSKAYTNVNLSLQLLWLFKIKTIWTSLGWTTIFKWYFSHLKMSNIYWINSIFAAYPTWAPVRRSDYSCLQFLSVEW